MMDRDNKMGNVDDKLQSLVDVLLDVVVENVMQCWFREQFIIICSLL